jgi:hypothetical protein
MTAHLSQPTCSLSAPDPDDGLSHLSQPPCTMNCTCKLYMFSLSAPDPDDGTSFTTYL